MVHDHNYCDGLAKPSWSKRRKFSQLYYHLFSVLPCNDLAPQNEIYSTEGFSGSGSSCKKMNEELGKRVLYGTQSKEIKYTIAIGTLYNVTICLQVEM